TCPSDAAPRTPPGATRWERVLGVRTDGRNGQRGGSSPLRSGGTTPGPSVVVGVSGDAAGDEPGADGVPVPGAPVASTGAAVVAAGAPAAAARASAPGVESAEVRSGVVGSGRTGGVVGDGWACAGAAWRPASDRSPEDVFAAGVSTATLGPPARRRRAIHTRTNRIPRPMTSRQTQNATTDVYSDARRNDAVMTVCRVGSSWSSWA